MHIGHTETPSAQLYAMCTPCLALHLRELADSHFAIIAADQQQQALVSQQGWCMVQV